MIETEWLDKIEKTSHEVIHIPHELRNKEFYIKAIDRNPFCFEYITYENVSYDLAIYAIQKEERYTDKIRMLNHLKISISEAYYRKTDPAHYIKYFDDQGKSFSELCILYGIEHMKTFGEFISPVLTFLEVLEERYATVMTTNRKLLDFWITRRERGVISKIVIEPELPKAELSKLFFLKEFPKYLLFDLTTVKESDQKEEGWHVLDYSLDPFPVDHEFQAHGYFGPGWDLLGEKIIQCLVQNSRQ